MITCFLTGCVRISARELRTFALLFFIPVVFAACAGVPDVPADVLLACPADVLLACPAAVPLDVCADAMVGTAMAAATRAAM